MSLLRSYTTVGGATLASRLTGFVRDILIAAVLGSSAIADAYIAAFLLPNLFRRVLSEGAFNAAFIPIFARRRAEQGEASVHRFAYNALSSLTLLVIAALIICELMMPWIIGGLAPGFHAQPQKFADAVTFGRIAFVFVGMIIVAALISSLLNAMGRYVLVAFAPLALNILMIAVLVGLVLLGWRESRSAGLVMVITVLIAGILQLAIVLRGAHRAGLAISLGKPERDRDVMKLLWLIIPGLMIAGAGHFNMVVAAQLSSSLPSAVSWLYYADRIFQLPLGFVAASIGTVLLPEVARALGQGERERAEDAGNRALEFGMMLVLPAALALSVLAEPIIDIIYRRGAFSAADSVATASILTILAAGLPGFVLVKVFLPPYLAREDMRLPIYASLAGVAVNIIVTAALLGRYHHVAAAIGVAASAWTNAAVLGGGLLLRGTFRLDAAAIRNLPRILLAAIATAGMAYVLKGMFSSWLAADARLGLRVFALAAICVSGVIVHVGLIFALRVADVDALRHAFKRERAT